MTQQQGASDDWDADGAGFVHYYDIMGYNPEIPIWDIDMAGQFVAIKSKRGFGKLVADPSLYGQALREIQQA